MPTGVDLLNKAKELTSRGADYKRGATGQDYNRNGKPDFDCSGLVMRALWELGYKDIDG